MNPVISRFVRIAIALSIAPMVTAQESAAVDDGTLEEILVTAQKREESLRDVPLSVEAISGDKLLEAGILRMDDLKAYIPNLQMTETAIANNIYIRGIGSGLNQGFEQSVSTYADGIYRGRGHQSRMPFLDLARIEVLRGPQPILFGKNAVAGAVNLIAAKPGKTFAGFARAAHDFENEDTVANLVLSGPLSARVGGRIAIHHRNADGYIRNLTLGRNEPLRDELGARLTFTFDATDNLAFTWRTETGSYNTVGRQIEIFGETPIATGSLAGLRYSQIIAGPVPALGSGQNTTASNNVIDYQRSSNGDGSKMSNFESALTAEYHFNNDLTLTSVTGVSNYTLDERCDCDFVGGAVFNASITEDYKQFSQEIRLASPADRALSWIGGVIFQDTKLDETDNLYVPQNSIVAPVLTQAFYTRFLTNTPPIICTTLAQCAGAANAFRNAANPRIFTQDSTLLSAFMQASWQATEALKVTAGGRFSSEDKEGSRVTTLTAGIGGPNLPAQVVPLFGPATLGIIPHSEAGSRSESTFSPLINVQYSFAPQSMVYLSWAEGSKAGGFDARSNKPVSAGGTFEFEDEKASTIELGVKSAIGDTADINAAVFFTDYKDLQTSAFDGAIGFNVGNGSAKVKGAELEGRWRVTRDFRLTGSVGYLDFEWTRYIGQCYFGAPAAIVVTPGNCNYKGFSNQLAPKFTGVVSGDYGWNLGAHLRMNAVLDLSYSAKFLQSLTLDPAATQAAFTKINARLALGDVDGGWEVALVGRNLTDETTVSYAGDTPLSQRLFSARSYYGFVDPPRSVALEASLRF
jgi:iron complex outermembrane recepter protein